MYVYSETGILVDRVSYKKEIADKYGKPIEISENGLILIFRNGHDIQRSIVFVGSTLLGLVSIIVTWY